tara:strand:+ start:2151 stop:2456 length:306 start_codon:yes stop_codon:yes gene_type:complete
MNNKGVEMSVKKTIEAIQQMDSEDLNSIITAIKLRRNQLHFRDAQSFKVGDRVSFNGRHGAVLKGTIEKVKIKYILVRTDAGQRWNVPGSHLTPIKEKSNA